MLGHNCVFQVDYVVHCLSNVDMSSLRVPKSMTSYSYTRTCTITLCVWGGVGVGVEGGGYLF